MRRSTLNLLRCPLCLAGSLVPLDDVADTSLAFGPARCIGCGAQFPVHEGLVDLGGDREGSGIQGVMERPFFARTWDRSVRPAFDALLTQGRLDRDREFEMLATFIGTPTGPLVDLGCGSGQLLRRLARELTGHQVIGVDLARPMLEEAIAQTREHGEAIDFVRAMVPPLPFVDHVISTVIAAGFIHFVADFDGLLRDVARVLKPRGRFVATTWEAPKVLRSLHGAAGFYPRTEDALRKAAMNAGFIRFERIKVSPFITWKVELP
jgi:ubiquinone/menaquinone biosynthesis C-methylase UbiE